MASLWSVFQTVLPILLLTGVGATLNRTRFFGPHFIADLNKLAFWIALPCLIFRSLARAQVPSWDLWRLIAAALAFTLLTAAVVWVGCLLLSMPREKIGTVIQGAFRGNLAYTGFPILFFAWSDLPRGEVDALASRVLLTFAPMMLLYNVLSIVVLQASRGDRTTHLGRALVLPIVTNPLILSSILGLAVAASGWTLPQPVDRTLEAMANFALPAALISLGGSLKLSGLRSIGLPVGLSTAGKLLIAPLLALTMAQLFGLSVADTRIALVFGCCPTAVVSYIMASQMGGDIPVASGIISLTTLLSIIPLTIALILTQ